MGWHFTLQQANTVAWLTAPTKSNGDISVDLSAAHDLFMGIATKSSARETGIISAREMGIHCTHGNWQEDIYQDCVDYGRRHSWNEVVEADVRLQLSRFRRHFDGYHLYAMGIPGDWDDTRHESSLYAFLRDGAFSSEAFGLFLILEEYASNQSILTPFPAFRLVGSVPTTLPAVLFWTPSGKAALCGLNESRDLYYRIRPVIGVAASVDRILDDFTRHQTQAPVLLQLSDLHFGTARARDSQNYLLQAIERVATEREISRVVITGDLFDNPSREHETQFIGFRQRLHAVIGKDPIVIPGNHDQRAWLGMFRRRLREAADLEWSSIVADDSLQMTFICFDSSKEGDGARGRVSVQHRLDMAAAFDSFLNRNQNSKDYLRIALVHHHPFSFNIPASGWWKMLEKIGFTEEDFLMMDDAEDFVKWCASRDASIILHGHKHVPYFAEGSVRVKGLSGEETLRKIPSIGCGSSTGAGNLPMSMNLLTWFPLERRWSASFLIDPGDGQGFAEQRIDINTVELV